MKLIIDIPDEDYNNIKTHNGFNGVSLARIVEKAIPLEDIKAEIKEYKDDKVIHAERNEMVDIVLEIIDKHIGE